MTTFPNPSQPPMTAPEGGAARMSPSDLRGVRDAVLDSAGPLAVAGAGTAAGWAGTLGPVDAVLDLRGLARRGSRREGGQAEQAAGELSPSGLFRCHHGSPFCECVRAGGGPRPSGRA